jgi:hypothetical protein
MLSVSTLSLRCVVMLSSLDTERHTFVMLSTIILNVVMPCVIMLIVICNKCGIFIFILCDGMSSVIIMSVDRLNVMAPLTSPPWATQRIYDCFRRPTVSYFCCQRRQCKRTFRSDGSLNRANAIRVPLKGL